MNKGLILSKSAQLELSKLKTKVQKKLLINHTVSQNSKEFQQLIHGNANKASKILTLKVDDIIDLLYIFVATELKAGTSFFTFSFKQCALEAMMEAKSPNFVATFQKVFTQVKAQQTYFDPFLSWYAQHYREFSEEHHNQILWFFVQKEMEGVTFGHHFEDLDDDKFLYVLSLVQLIKGETLVAFPHLTNRLNQVSLEPEIKLWVDKLIRLHLVPPSKYLLERKIKEELNMLKAQSTTEETDLTATESLPLSFLPHEILSYIVDFLDPQSLQNMRLTSKEWNDLTNNEYIWQNTCYRHITETNTKDHLHELLALLSEKKLKSWKFVYALSEKSDSFRDQCERLLNAVAVGCNTAVQLYSEHHKMELLNFADQLPAIQELLFHKCIMIAKSASSKLPSHLRVLTSFQRACIAFHDLALYTYDVVSGAQMKQLRTILYNDMQHKNTCISVMDSFRVVAKKLATDTSRSLLDYFEKLLLNGRCASRDYTASLLLEYKGVAFCKQLLKEDILKTFSPSIFIPLILKELGQTTDVPLSLCKHILSFFAPHDLHALVNKISQVQTLQASLRYAYVLTLESFALLQGEEADWNAALQLLRMKLPLDKYDNLRLVISTAYYWERDERIYKEVLALIHPECVPVPELPQDCLAYLISLLRDEVEDIVMYSDDKSDD